MPRSQIIERVCIALFTGLIVVAYIKHSQGLGLAACAGAVLLALVLAGGTWGHNFALWRQRKPKREANETARPLWIVAAVLAVIAALGFFTHHNRWAWFALAGVGGIPVVLICVNRHEHRRRNS